jgi:site-specific DNA-methyltransferase (adenine-specific)
MNKDACFSSGKDDWETPPKIFQPLHKEFHFGLDLAANQANHKVGLWYGPGGLVEDALSVARWPTDIPCWLNPPYSRKLQWAFVHMAAAVGSNGGLVVLLLPARTDTKIFHGLIWDRDAHRPYHGVGLRFLKGRIRFVGASAGAPFPSMIVIFGRTP